MISFSGNVISLAGLQIKLEHDISDAREIDGRCVVLFDPDAYTSRFGQFPNLIALDSAGRRLWTAELPSTTSGDRYYKIVSERPLIVYSIYSEECELDLLTGSIKTKRSFR
jgi:hypothetical protein